MYNLLFKDGLNYNIILTKILFWLIFAGVCISIAAIIAMFFSGIPHLMQTAGIMLVYVIIYAIMLPAYRGYITMAELVRDNLKK